MVNFGDPKFFQYFFHHFPQKYLEELRKNHTFWPIFFSPKVIFLTSEKNFFW